MTFARRRRTNGDWELYERRFIDLMRSRKIENTRRDILDESCLLCSEEKPHHCHRRLVAEYLQERWDHVESSTSYSYSGVPRPPRTYGVPAERCVDSYRQPLRANTAKRQQAPHPSLFDCQRSSVPKIVPSGRLYNLS